MKQLIEFTIPFIGLKQGEHLFDFKIDDTFFQNFEYDEFHSVLVDAKVKMQKKSNGLEFDFLIKGTVNVNCDVTNEPYDQPIKGKYHLTVNFGNEYNNDEDALLIIPHGSYEINIQQYLYELIVLSVPTKRIHPGIEDGTLDSEILKKLEELKPKPLEEKLPKEETDPRWDKLKKLLTDK